MSYVYAIGRVEARFPNLAAEKEFAQATGRTETTGKTDQQTFHTVLCKRENRYPVRQLCWVLSIHGLETYLLAPRDPADIECFLVKPSVPPPAPTTSTSSSACAAPPPRLHSIRSTRSIATILRPLNQHMIRRCEMNVPGYTAEASLYKKSACYLTTVNFAQREGIIAPAQFGEIFGPDGPGVPKLPPQLERPPLIRFVCYYDCRFVSRWFDPCPLRCYPIWAG